MNYIEKLKKVAQTLGEDQLDVEIVKAICRPLTAELNSRLGFWSIQEFDGKRLYVKVKTYDHHQTREGALAALGKFLHDDSSWEKTPYIDWNDHVKTQYQRTLYIPAYDEEVDGTPITVRPVVHISYEVDGLRSSKCKVEEKVVKTITCDV